jgi:hypothetical protein
MWLHNDRSRRAEAGAASRVRGNSEDRRSGDLTLVREIRSTEPAGRSTPEQALVLRSRRARRRERARPACRAWSPVPTRGRIAAHPHIACADEGSIETLQIRIAFPGQAAAAQPLDLASDARGRRFETRRAHPIQDATEPAGWRARLRLALHERHGSSSGSALHVGHGLALHHRHGSSPSDLAAHRRHGSSPLRI